MGDIRVKEKIGTGMIPLEYIVDWRMKQGQPDTIDVIYVKHFTDGVEDGISTIGLKSMEQGRGKFQGTARHYIWLDEQSKRGDSYEIFSESRTRTMVLEGCPEGGQVLCTLSPLEGMDALCKYALSESVKDPEVTIVNITWDEAPHLDAKAREDLERSMLPHEIEARKYGRPVIKEGLVFPFAESTYVVDPIPIPEHWAILGGLDVGFTAPTAAVLMARDPLTGTVYIINEYAMAETDRAAHGKALKAWGDGLRFETDPSANRTESDGKKTMQVYRDMGLNVQNANNDVEHGIYSMFELFKLGLLKVFRNLHGIREELRFYQYSNGHIRKTKDHRLDAARYCVVGIKAGKARPMKFWAYEHRQKFASSGGRHADRYRPADPHAGY
jgi:phage terminase large subunit-like protein